MIYPEHPGDITVLGLKQPRVLLLLHLDLLDVGLGAAPHTALHVQHLQEAGALKINKSETFLIVIGVKPEQIQIFNV